MPILLGFLPWRAPVAGHSSPFPSRKCFLYTARSRRIVLPLNLIISLFLAQQLPRHNLAAASLLVKRFASNQGLEYAEFGFVAGNREVLGVLADVASQVGVVGMVAKSEVEKAVKGQH
jgi:hypothetical protein